jgi:hypothetical protein
MEDESFSEYYHIMLFVSQFLLMIMLHFLSTFLGHAVLFSNKFGGCKYVDANHMLAVAV